MRESEVTIFVAIHSQGETLESLPGDLGKASTEPQRNSLGHSKDEILHFLYLYSMRADVKW